MTLFQRIRSFFSPKSSASGSTTGLTTLPERSVIYVPMPPQQSHSEPLPVVSPQLTTALTSLPDWLADEESLRDEGVLFGLSTARPDGKLTQIRAYFSQQAAPWEEQIEQYTEKIGELNLFIEQRENRLLALNDQISDLRDRQPTKHNLAQHVVSLVSSIIMSVGIFYLIDDTLHPIFPNRWIAVGVFLAGMFNWIGRTSFFHETSTRLTSRQLVAEVGLPFATALFVLTSALQTQSFGRAISLFVFVFFLFLFAGRLLLTTLSALQADQAVIVDNRQLRIDKAQNLPLWKTDIEQLSREIDTIRTQKWPLVTLLNHAQTELSRLNAKRDALVNLFLSEFELARSLRDQLTEQQRKQIMDYGL